MRRMIQCMFRAPRVRADPRGPSRVRAAPRGQSLVEFALIAPVLFLILLGTIQVAQGIMTWSAVGSVVSEATREAAIAGGETATVDNKIQQFALANHLNPGAMTVQIDTDSGSGLPHSANPPVANGDYPPRTVYDNTVTVHVSYALPLIFSIGGAHTWNIGSAQSGGVSTSVGGAP